MCDCVQLGDYICCPRDKPKDKCIEVGNYICCPREKQRGTACENFRNSSNYNQRNFCRNGSATKSCNCARSRSAEPQPRFVEEKFSNMIPPSFLCKNTDPPKPKIRKPKVCKKVKPKTDTSCIPPIYGPAANLLPGIYVPEGVTIAPQTPQANTEDPNATFDTGEPGQQTGNPNPNVSANIVPGYMPGYTPNSGVAAPAIPGYMPGSIGYPANPNLIGYPPTIPGYQYPAVGPFGSTFVIPPQMPQAPGVNPNQSGYGESAPIGGQSADSNLGNHIESTAGQKRQHPAAGLPSCRQPPFDPCTGEECNPERCLIRRSKSNSPAPRSRNGLGVGFGPQRQYHPHHTKGSQRVGEEDEEEDEEEEEEQTVAKSCCQRNLDPPPMFNCCCHCSLSSDLIERICKSLQISSSIQNYCCGNCQKMSATKKSNSINVPVPKRKPKTGKDSNSQMALSASKRDNQGDKTPQSKLGGGLTARSGSLTDSQGNGNKSPHESPQALTDIEAIDTPTTKDVCTCGCKDFCTAESMSPATKSCSCYANIMARSDDSTQTPPPEKNELVNQNDRGGQQGPCCGIGGACGTPCGTPCGSPCGTPCGTACGTTCGTPCGLNNNTGGSCCKPGCSSCCGNSCCWPYYYYYDPCTGMYYCYRNCCYGCCNSCCTPCCSTSCCQSNSKSCKTGGNKSAKDTHYPSPASTPKRKDSKSTTPSVRKTSPQRNMGGDAMSPIHPEMQDVYNQWLNFQQHYIKQYPQATLPNPVPAVVPGGNTNPNGYYAPAISTPFYFASSYHNQMNMNAAPNRCSPLNQFPNSMTPYYQQPQKKQPETDIDFTPQ